MKTFKINSTNKINNKIIDDTIFQEEKVNYTIVEREYLIDSLIGWISEVKKDKELMKEDLKYLISINDKYVLSSILTNEYILENTKEGQAILKEMYNIK